MTPDELRALADAKPVAAMPPLPANWTERHTSVQAWVESDGVQLNVHGNFDSNDQRIAYAQEIARRLNAAPTSPAGWRLVPVEPTPEMLSAVGMMDGYDWHAPGCSPDADHVNWYSAMIAAAPAAPQAAPMADSDADYWLRNRQSILDGIERAGFMLMSNASGFWLHPRGKTDAQAGPIDPHMIVAEDRFPDVLAERWKPCPQCGEDVDRECPICDGLGRVLATDSEQVEPKRELTAGERDVLDSALRSSVRLVARGVAEPKREPLSYEQLVSACYTYRHDFGLLDPDEQELVIEEAGRWAKAFGIGGSDAE